MIDVKSMPKVELHCHLDGSVRVSTAAELLDCNETDLRYEMIAQNKCDNLSDYLTKFEIPIKVMQSKYALEKIAYDLTIDMKNDNVIYAEIRFAPLKHINEELTLIDVMESVFRGLKRTELKTNVILCMMRGDSIDDNKMVIDLAAEYLNNGVCAIDLAGDEAHYKTEEYKELFEYAKEKNIPFTIHAGEADSKDSIASALSFGTKRIGHGVRILEDEKLIKEVIDKDILLEICPTSNIQTRVINGYKEHPIKKIYDLGIKVSINTDNRTVSNTNLSREYQLLIDNLNITESELIDMNKMAIKHAFLSIEEKEKLMNKYNSLI